jgi:transposase
VIRSSTRTASSVPLTSCLFARDNEVLLYDVTSTYFEGQAEENPFAQRGYSRDHRSDCK